MIVCRDVDFAYPGGAPVLSGFSLELPPGKVCAIMGASGGGKTTVLRLLSGQQRATRGEVRVFDQDVAQLDEKGLRTLRRRIGMLFQLGALFTDLSVFDNVAFPLREHTQLPETMVRDITLMKLHAVGLRGACDLMPAGISGGMARRVALARAIALDPELMMYDEPFAGLDPIALGTTARLIRELNDALGMTSVLVSHDVDETFRIADWVVVLAGGAVAAQGTPQQLRASDDPLLRQFLGAHAQGPVPFHYPAPSLWQDFGLADHGHHA